MINKSDFDEGYDAGWMACILTLRIAFSEKITMEKALKKLNPADVIAEMRRRK
jgi:hypothetical protein